VHAVRGSEMDEMQQIARKLVSGWLRMKWFSAVYSSTCCSELLVRCGRHFRPCAVQLVRCNGSCES
jgi:hypothetical protein